MSGISLGLVFSSLTVLFKAGKSISTKIGVTNSNEFVTSWSFRTISFILFGVTVLFLGRFTVPSSSVFWIAVVFNSLALATTTILITKAFSISDISVIAPLMALVPVVVSIPAWIVLGEVPSSQAGLGLILVVLGSYLLKIQSGGSTGGFLAPFKRLKDDRGAQYIALMLLIVSVTPTVDKIGLSNSSPLLWVFYLHFGISVVLGVCVYLFTSDWSSDVTTNWKIFILIGVFNTGLWTAQIYAYEIMYVAYVQGIKRASMIISIIAGSVIFNEENIKNKLVGGICILFGVVLIVIGS